jgi:hypothetical protein
MADLKIKSRSEGSAEKCAWVWASMYSPKPKDHTRNMMLERSHSLLTFLFSMEQYCLMDTSRQITMIDERTTRISGNTNVQWLTTADI